MFMLLCYTSTYCHYTYSSSSVFQDQINLWTNQYNKYIIFIFILIFPIFIIVHMQWRVSNN